eukprot:2818860-Rhodomonas_salina.1
MRKTDTACADAFSRCGASSRCAPASSLGASSCCAPASSLGASSCCAPASSLGASSRCAPASSLGDPSRCVTCCAQNFTSALPSTSQPPTKNLYTPLSAYAPPMRCPVLAWPSRHRHLRCPY